MTYHFRPQGVCARVIEIDLNENVIENVRYFGGCSGNLQGIAKLLEGMSPDEAIKRLRGIRCGAKPTSCPDQTALALEQILAQK